ncbi:MULTISPECIES: HAD family hydrolase [Burkholderia cepacia complex]|uniref:HAD family hydrolase n=1 Tax=Burkholderia cepacia complex TaxID=87882 RepID=UPI001178A895|nr:MULTISPECIES: HAD family hydrolase [Burkholderia cepacia complex]MBR8290508.1 HAD family hydrolase [Burkholderia cenocepacia]MDK0996936.1 HAD hydrolase-like protein [Burkholderia contaminans]
MAFDLYGTLARRNPVAGALHPYEVFYTRVGEALEVPVADVRSALLTTDGADILECCAPALQGRPAVSGVAARAIASAAAEVRRANCEYEGVPALVHALRQAVDAGAEVAVLSNAAAFMEPAALLERIGVSVRAIFSYRVGAAKPDVTAFGAVWSDTADGPTIMVGDNWRSDILGAVSAGWRAVYTGAPRSQLLQARRAVQALAGHNATTKNPAAHEALRNLHVCLKPGGILDALSAASRP